MMFYAIPFNNASFVTKCTDNNIPAKYYTLMQPSPTRAVIFPTTYLDEVLALLDVKKENIKEYIPSERSNISIIRLDNVYDVNIVYGSRYGEVKLFFENSEWELTELGKYLNIEKINIKSDDNREDSSADNICIHLCQNPYDYPQIKDYIQISENTSFPFIEDRSYKIYHLESFIKYQISVAGNPMGFVIGRNVYLLSGKLAWYDDLTDDIRKEIVNEISAQLKEIYGKNMENLNTMISEMEEYNFQKFLKTVFDARTRTYREQLEDAKNSIENLRRQMVELHQSIDTYNRYFRAFDMKSEKEDFIASLSVIKKSKAVKDILFESYGINIILKHIYIKFSSREEPGLVGRYFHIGELELRIPYDSNDPIRVYRHNNPDDTLEYPESTEPHPNVYSTHNVCYNNIATEIAELQAMYSISGIFTIMYGFLSTYNIDSTTISASYFPHMTKEESEEYVRNLYNEEEPEKATETETE